MLRSQKCPSIMPLIAVNETWNGSSGRSSFKRGPCLQWCALPIFNDRIQTGHENWGTGAVLRKMGVTPDSGLASLWLLLLFCEQCSHMEQHPIVVQWNLFTHRTGFDYYCCCSHREEHPSALDHLGRTWVSCAIFHIFSKPSFWLSGLISQGILRFHCSVCIWYRVIDYF